MKTSYRYLLTILISLAAAVIAHFAVPDLDAETLAIILLIGYAAGAFIQWIATRIPSVPEIASQIPAYRLFFDEKWTDPIKLVMYKGGPGFRFNDADGRALVYAGPFKTTEERDQAVQRLLLGCWEREMRGIPRHNGQAVVHLEPAENLLRG